ncbi:hypothetical protein EVA_10902 [gut metagenome]|uniref:Uncharacterized protein n=1 Tax=gut metagenome TaxID=749906 RepID=J9GGN7_9ZZZZ
MKIKLLHEQMARKKNWHIRIYNHSCKDRICRGLKRRIELY